MWCARLPYGPAPTQLNLVLNYNVWQQWHVCNNLQLQVQGPPVVNYGKGAPKGLKVWRLQMGKGVRGCVGSPFYTQQFETGWQVNRPKTHYEQK